MRDYKYVVIEGNIGAGKTTLAKLMSEKMNARLILEQFSDNPFLPKFYSDPDKYSFQLELSFLAERYHQINNDLQNRDLFKPLSIADYYPMKSLIFSRNNLSEDEFQLYRQIFDIISANIIKPDIYVYLHLSLDHLIRNIKSRGRYYEQSIQKEYLVKIQEGYMDFLKKQKNLTTLMIDIESLDYQNKQSDLEYIIDVVFNQEYGPGINKIIP